MVMMESQPLQDPTATAPAPGSAEPAGAPPAVVSAAFISCSSCFVCSAAPLLRSGSDSAHCLATEPGRILSFLQTPGKEFTRTCKGLVVVLIGGYVLLQLLPSSLNYLAIIPSK